MKRKMDRKALERVGELYIKINCSSLEKEEKKDLAISFGFKSFSALKADITRKWNANREEIIMWQEIAEIEQHKEDSKVIIALLRQFDEREICDRYMTLIWNMEEKLKEYNKINSENK